MTNLFRSARLRFAPFTLDDAADVYACITPEIARFMRWDPPASSDAFRDRRRDLLQAEDQSDLSFVIRYAATLECLGTAAIEGVACPAPEIGLWLKADAHGRGHGFDVVQAVVTWATRALGSTGFDYPVASQNIASRRIAERLGGRAIGERHGATYTAVVYRIPAPPHDAARVLDDD